MNDSIIELPNNYEHNMKLGQLAFEEKNYQEALNYFQEAYNLKNELLANEWLVKTAMVLNNYELAEKIATERLTDYLAEPSKLASYIECLIALNKFQRARLFIEVYSLGDDKLKFETLLNQTEQQRKQFHARSIEEVNQKLASWYPKPHEILQFLEQLNSLPYDSFMKQLTRMLTDKKHSLILRNQLLNTLRLLNYSEPVEIIDYANQMRTVTPVDLEVLGRERYYLDLNEVLNRMVGEQPDVLKQLLADQRRFFNILYPLASEEITSLKNWLSVTLAPYNGLIRMPIDDLADEEVPEIALFNQILFQMGLKN